MSTEEMHLEVLNVLSKLRPGESLEPVLTCAYHEFHIVLGHSNAEFCICFH
jgi:hypothetical protein